MTGTPHEAAPDIRDLLREAVEHLAHVLPGQAPIRDFVHHNTLHGFEHLHFREAVAEAGRVTGARGFLPEARFRELFAQGRIDAGDLDGALDDEPGLEVGERVCESRVRPVCRRDVYRAAMLHPLEPVTVCQLTWQFEERDARHRFQPDVSAESRRQLLEAARLHGVESEREAIDDLWTACLESLGLTHYIMHPEDLVDLAPEQAQVMLESLAQGDEGTRERVKLDHLIRKQADHRLEELLGRVGRELTLRGLLLALTGTDILEELQPMLLRQLANYLDQGVAAWHAPDRDDGFFRVWRRSARHDPTPLFSELDDWGNHLDSLPDDPLETVMAELKRLGLRQAEWAGYLERLALELPGWSGMVLWRHGHPGYEGLAPARVEMMDYLAVRLVLERLFAQRLCARLWRVEASLFTLRWYFHHHRPEFLVRHTLFNERLPEYLATRAHDLADRTAENRQDEAAWRQLAQMIWTWRQSPAADRPLGYSVYRSAWPLFRLAQHLGLCGDDLRGLPPERVERVFDALARLDPDRRAFLWLRAYEHHYREQLFTALAAPRARHDPAVRRPSAQLVFCMDDREEGFRRHLEEVDPTLETLGAAAHFNVFNFWRGLDDEKATPLCPVVAVPGHAVRELPRGGEETALERRDRRRRLGRLLTDLVHVEARRNLLSSVPLVALAAPFALPLLVGKAFAPLATERLRERWRARFEPAVRTQIAFCAPDDAPPPSPAAPRAGFADAEQAERAEAFLRNIGLVDRFAPIVVIMAHGSSSRNNPHAAAYDCGACSGRHSGPNARILAAMLNRERTRATLAGRGIAIPGETWFIGAEHDTCDDGIEWYELDRVPPESRPGLDALRGALDEAGRRHARERCRRLASAPLGLTPGQALDHVAGRARDFSQARPELGHATNAAALIGRRSLSRGLFLDRRTFLISYDATTDPEGEVLERLLLANAPVGAGINLEYYFSTVDNANFGCGSKVTHNVTGLFGVMDGAASDLRTGLPRQMIEIHEAMRLQVVVEASTAVIGAIYARQPPLQQLIGNGWLLVSAIDPQTGAIAVFDPERGFTPWQGSGEALPRAPSSDAWFAGRREPLPPAVIGPAEESARA